MIFKNTKILWNLKKTLKSLFFATKNKYLKKKQKSEFVEQYENFSKNSGNFSTSGSPVALLISELSPSRYFVASISSNSTSSGSCRNGKSYQLDSMLFLVLVCRRVFTGGFQIQSEFWPLGQFLFRAHEMYLFLFAFLSCCLSYANQRPGPSPGPPYNPVLAPVENRIPQELEEWPRWPQM